MKIKTYIATFGADIPQFGDHEFHAASDEAALAHIRANWREIVGHVEMENCLGGPINWRILAIDDEAGKEIAMGIGLTDDAAELSRPAVEHADALLALCQTLADHAFSDDDISEHDAPEAPPHDPAHCALCAYRDLMAKCEVLTTTSRSSE